MAKKKAKAKKTKKRKTGKKAVDADMSVKMVPLRQITPYAQNPRDNDAAVDAVARSITEYGFRQPIVVDADGTIICGHTRYKAAVALGLRQVPVHKALDLSPEKAKAYRIADNKVAEAAMWRNDVLAMEVGELVRFSEMPEYDLDITALGFSDGELEALLATDDAIADETNDIPEPPEEPKAQRGDVYVLGNHKICCGDSTSMADIERLGVPADCQSLVWDPEWDVIDIDVPVIGSPHDRLAFADGCRLGDVVARFGAPTWVFVWDCVTSWYTPNRPLRRMKLCCWYGDIGSYNPNGAHYGEPGESKTVTNSRGTYEYRPDLRGKHLSDCFVAPITQLHAEDGPSHSKPVDWMRMLLGNCTSGDIFDPFGGSGTSIIAAEQLGRRCYAMELEPRNVDVCVKRWENFTGREATLEREDKGRGT